MRRTIAAGAALLVVAALAGCSLVNPTADVHGAVVLRPGSFSAPGATTAASASACVRSAQTDADLKACETAAVSRSVVACAATPELPGVRRAAELDVLDTGGKVIGVGHLGTGRTTRAGTCSFPFAVPDVPAGQAIYGLRISGSATEIAHFTKRELFDRSADLVLG